jgi:hypothetical protein
LGWIKFEGLMNRREVQPMTKPVMETVTFKLKEGVSREAFTAAAENMNAFVIAQPGFVSRRLSCTADGEWIEQVQWSDMASAKKAAAAIGTVEGNRPFLSAIDGPTVQMRHSELEVSVS